MQGLDLEKDMIYFFFYEPVDVWDMVNHHTFLFNQNIDYLIITSFSSSQYSLDRVQFLT